MCAMVFTEQQKIKIIKFWYESKSYVEVRRSFCREFNVHTRDSPKNNAIKRIVKHFEDKGTVRNTNKGNSGRPASVTKIQENIDKVRNSTINSPKKSPSPSFTRLEDVFLQRVSYTKEGTTIVSVHHIC